MQLFSTSTEASLDISAGVSNPPSPKLIFEKNRYFRGKVALSLFHRGFVNINKQKSPLQQHLRMRLHIFKLISFDRVRACFVFAGQLCG